MDRSDIVFSIFMALIIGLFVFVMIYVIGSPRDFITTEKLGNKGTFVCQVKSDWWDKNWSKQCMEWRPE